MLRRKLYISFTVCVLREVIIKKKKKTGTRIITIYEHCWIKKKIRSTVERNKQSRTHTHTSAHTQWRTNGINIVAKALLNYMEWNLLGAHLFISLLLVSVIFFLFCTAAPIPVCEWMRWKQCQIKTEWVWAKLFGQAFFSISFSFFLPIVQFTPMTMRYVVWVLFWFFHVLYVLSFLFSLINIFDGIAFFAKRIE